MKEFKSSLREINSMLLDSQAFKPVLTPEAALGIVQKTISSRGWKQYDVSDVKLVYTPYWVFSFDVLAGEASPTGKTALNAYTGELNDFIPYLMDRPLKKTTQTEEGVEAEIMPTAISKGEIKDVAATKVAATAGIKKELVSISAATKYYVPSYQVWVDAAGDSFKIDVDALVGNPMGADAIPARPQTWNESAGNTLSKLKSPSGWLELIGKTVGALTSMGKPGGNKNDAVKYVVLILIIIALGYFVFFRNTATTGSVTCDLSANYYNAPELFGFGAKTVRPAADADGNLFVQGKCVFYNKGKDDAVGIIAINRIQAGGRPVAQNTSSVGILAPTGDVGTEKIFTIAWQGSRNIKYTYSYCRVEQCR